ncbi:hypothetical protein BHM03_00029626 [Ensete ventricosum]|nr:hypothetical protein BHM03_00029626 [Ensete ventricosum]
MLRRETVWNRERRGAKGALRVVLLFAWPVMLAMAAAKGIARDCSYDAIVEEATVARLWRLRKRMAVEAKTGAVGVDGNIGVVDARTMGKGQL